MEKRGSALIDIDRENLENRMKIYFDKSIEFETFAELDTGLTKRFGAF